MTTLCSYGCNSPAKFFLGKTQVPCCCSSLQQCPAHKSKRNRVKEAPKGAICFYCLSIAKYLLGKKQTPCCASTLFKCPKYHSLLASRPKGGRKPGEVISSNLLLPGCNSVCFYCKQPANYLIGKKSIPCCSSSLYSCPSIRQKKIDSRGRVTPNPDESLVCSYGCGSKALYLIGKEGKPCCSKASNSCHAISVKRESTTFNHYGVKNNFSSPEIQANITATCLAKYGGNPMLNPLIKEKRNRTNLERFGVRHSSQNPDVAKRISDSKMGVPIRQEAYQFVFIPPNEDKLCAYCGLKAYFYMGKTSLIPCCSTHFQCCPRYVEQRGVSIVIEDGAICSYGCGTPAKYKIGFNERPCCSASYQQCSAHILSHINTGGRPLQSPTSVVPVSKGLNIPCAYGCDQPSLFLVGRRNTPCCSSLASLCPAIPRTPMTVEAIYGNKTKRCSYGCGEIAEYAFSNGQVCCSDTYYDCPGHWKKVLSGGYTPKVYTLPSGKEIILQGFEPQVLEYMLGSGWREEEFQFDVNKRPVIRYEDEEGKSHAYYMDFYLPQANTVVEVKSLWTLCGLPRFTKINEAKRSACITAGYNFMLVVWDKTFKAQVVPSDLSLAKLVFDKSLHLVFSKLSRYGSCL
jgi:hypothetical protein